MAWKSFKELKKGDVFYARKEGLPYNEYNVTKLTVEEIHIEEMPSSCIHYDYDVDWGCTGSKVISYKYPLGYIVALHYFNSFENGEGYLSYLIIPIDKSNYSKNIVYLTIPSGEKYIFTTDENYFIEKYKNYLKDKKEKQSIIEGEIERIENELKEIEKSK